MRSRRTATARSIADWKQLDNLSHPHLRRARTPRRPRSAQRPAPAFRAARILQLPDPRRGHQGESGRRDPRAEGRQAAAEDARRRPGREPDGKAADRCAVAPRPRDAGTALLVRAAARGTRRPRRRRPRSRRPHRARARQGLEDTHPAGGQQAIARASRLARGSRRPRQGAARRFSSVRAASVSARARSRNASAAGRRPAASACRCTRICCAIPSRRTCSSRAATCAACRNFSATRTSVRRRCTRTLISSTWPASTTNPIRAPDGASN